MVGKILKTHQLVFFQTTLVNFIDMDRAGTIIPLHKPIIEHLNKITYTSELFEGEDHVYSYCIFDQQAMEVPLFRKPNRFLVF